MKKIVSSLFVLALLLSSFISCTAKENTKAGEKESETSQNQTKAEEELASKVEDTEASKKAVEAVKESAPLEQKKEAPINYVDCLLIYDEGSLWYENSKGELDWYTTISNSTRLKAYPASAASLSQEVESKKAVRSGKKEALEYTKVRFNEKDYWIQSVLLANNAIPRLLTKDAMIYTQADITAATSDVIPAGEIVASSGEEEDSELGTKFAKVTYRTEKRVFRNVFIKAENLSSNGDDVIAKRILNKIASSKNAVVKAELLDNISLLELSPALTEEVNAVRETLQSESEEE